MTWVPRAFQRRMSLARDGAQCRYCQREVWPKHMVPEEVWFDQGLTFDHFFPQHRSGPSEYWNLFVCCYRCNSVKAHTQPQTQDAVVAKRRKKWRAHPAPDNPIPLRPWHAGIPKTPWVDPRLPDP